MKTLTKLYFFAAAFLVIKSIEKDLKRHENDKVRLNDSLKHARKNYYEVVRVYEDRYGKIIK